MANFRGGNRSGGSRGFERRGFNDRGRRGPVEMHQAICDNCRKSCEVPFRPTSGKPIFCSSCFEGNRGPERSTNFEEKRIFEAICDECGSSCKVPFRPSGDKPVYCSNCFGDKKGAGSRENGQSQKQFEQLNNKLDEILMLLTSKAPVQAVAVQEETIEAVRDQQPEEQKIAKKKPSKKKSV